MFSPSVLLMSLGDAENFAWRYRKMVGCDRPRHVCHLHHRAKYPYKPKLHYINHMWTPEFLSHFTHAFLIRDPAKTISSMYNKWPDFDEGEVGFPEQRALFDLLTALDGGNPPPVVDSDDLLENPHDMTAAFCESVGIPFIEEALSWQAGDDPSAHSWWDGGSFHANLAQSTGLKPQVRKYVEVSDAPERVQQVHRRMKPHYDHLYQHRITL